MLITSVVQVSGRGTNVDFIIDATSPFSEVTKGLREYLIETHEFPPARVEARAWLREIDPPGPATKSVDARLFIPQRD